MELKIICHICFAGKPDSCKSNRNGRRDDEPGARPSTIFDLSTGSATNVSCFGNYSETSGIRQNPSGASNDHVQDEVNSVCQALVQRTSDDRDDMRPENEAVPQAVVLSDSCRASYDVSAIRNDVCSDDRIGEESRLLQNDETLYKNVETQSQRSEYDPSIHPNPTPNKQDCEAPNHLDHGASYNNLEVSEYQDHQGQVNHSTNSPQDRATHCGPSEEDEIETFSSLRDHNTSPPMQAPPEKPQVEHIFDFGVIPSENILPCGSTTNLYHTSPDHSRAPGTSMDGFPASTLSDCIKYRMGSENEPDGGNEETQLLKQGSTCQEIVDDDSPRLSPAPYSLTVQNRGLKHQSCVDDEAAQPSLVDERLDASSMDVTKAKQVYTNPQELVVDEVKLKKHSSGYGSMSDDNGVEPEETPLKTAVRQQESKPETLGRKTMSEALEIISK